MALTTVLVAGDNCLDRYLPPIAREFVGGQAVNVAIGLAAAAVAVAYAGVVGDDDAGRRILEELAARGVDTTATAIAEGPTGVTEIGTEDGERRFASERYGVSAPYVPSDKAIALARRVRLVYAAHVADIRPLAAALAPGALLALDASDGPLDSGALKNVDLLFRSTPGADPDETMLRASELLDAGPSTVVITLGAGGAVAVTRDGIRASCPASDGVPVDTLGAGDALAAGFIAASLIGASLQAALAAGSEAAWAACLHLGALPDAKLVETSRRVATPRRQPAGTST